MKLVKKLMVVALPLMLIAGCATQEALDKANQDSARISTTAEKAASAAAMAASSAAQAAEAATKAAKAAEQAAKAAERASAEARAAGDKADRVFRKGLRK